MLEPDAVLSRHMLIVQELIMDDFGKNSLTKSVEFFVNMDSRSDGSVGVISVNFNPPQVLMAIPGVCTNPTSAIIQLGESRSTQSMKPCANQSSVPVSSKTEAYICRLTS
ncbi:hypothetical protein DPMN_029249 [Dreissena polymorpha]|uniref:Uncharacterized protein n=1 Tax=Dreissena polymorpha TaxID=45954 RepID=A0A9D4RGY2_DREPO|nr:hypothetical protein DPMN_029249 [Dreissena polymorpha]